MEMVELIGKIDTRKFKEGAVQKDYKTIGITLRFWTNDLKVIHPSSDQSEVIACWDSGMAIIEANKKKVIHGMQIPFQCYEDIIPAVKELFRKNGILVASDNRRPRILSHKRRAK